MYTQDKPFDFDEYDNIIDNIEMTDHFLRMPSQFKWKWAIIALHQALYGMLIAALQGTDARQTVYDKQKINGKVASLHAQGVPINIIASSFGVTEDKVNNWLANPYIINIGEALRRIKQKEYLPWTDSEPLTTSREEDDAIDKLTKEFRNEFEHFTPKRWMIDPSGIPNMLKHVLRVVSFIAFESNSITLSLDQEKRFVDTFFKIDQVLNNNFQSLR